MRRSSATLALQYGITARPSLDDPNFVSTLVFDPSKPAGTPKARFAYLFPSPNAALVSVRMKAGLSEAQRDADDRADPPGGGDAAVAPAHGESYLVTGEPVIVSDLTGSITHSIELLLVAVLLVMARDAGAGLPRAPAAAAARRSRCSPRRSPSARCRSWGRR